MNFNYYKTKCWTTRSKIACQTCDTCDVSCKVETTMYKTNGKNYDIQFLII
jgi:hypothetical protein